MSDHPTTLRRLLAAAFMCVTLVLAGCGDDELEGRVDDLENRVASLETLCDEMNTNISSLHAAIQDGDYVTGVTPVTEGSLTIGYTITFARHQPIIVYNGENGSSLSIRQDSDGEYYWIMNGDWLLDKEGNKMNTSEKIPLLRIEEGQWLISVDDGDSWENMGQVTGAFFKSIDNSSDDHIDFVLADGTTVTIPKKLTFAITFSETLPRIAPGETIELAYTLSQGDDATLVKTVTSNGWKAEVIKKDNLSGTIRITAPIPITDDEVLVFISDGKEKTVMSAISFTILIVENAPDNTIQVSGGGGDLNIEVTANLPVSASSPDSWIQPVQDPQSPSSVLPSKPTKMNPIAPAPSKSKTPTAASCKPSLSPKATPSMKSSSVSGKSSLYFTIPPTATNGCEKTTGSATNLSMNGMELTRIRMEFGKWILVITN